MKYKNMIGDGKQANYYWVFQYDEKAISKNGEIDFPTNDKVEGGLIGRFSSYNKALECVDNKTYLPHVVIEDRISGVVFESRCIVCGCCGHEEWDSMEDIQFTKDKLGENFK